MRTATALSMVLLLGTANLGYAQQGAPGGAWPAYGGDAGSTKYAPLDQIDADNVDRLSNVVRSNDPSAGQHRRRGTGQGTGAASAGILPPEHLARFVELWKEADPELQPRVEAAQRRLNEIFAERG